MGVIDWKSKNIEDELSIYILVSQSFVDQLGESLRIKKGKRICPIAKTISQCFKALKTCLILQQSPQLWLGDIVLWYHQKIRRLILGRNCSYRRSALCWRYRSLPKANTTTICCSNPKIEKNLLMLDSIFYIFSPSIQI